MKLKPCTCILPKVPWAIAKIKYENFAGTLICPRFEELCERTIPMAPTLALHGGTGQVVASVIVTCLILVALL